MPSKFGAIHLTPLSIAIITLFAPFGVAGTIIRLAKLKKLVSVQFQGCHGLVGNVAVLANFKSLWLINFEGCSLSGHIRCLEQLTALATVNFNDCYDLQGSLHDLRYLTGLSDLSLRKCAHIEGDLDMLDRLNQLNVLNLSGCTRLEGYVPGSRENPKKQW